MTGDRITAVFRGRRHRVLARREAVVSLEPHPVGPRVDVSVPDPDLILDPAADDLELAIAFERGHIKRVRVPGRPHLSAESRDWFAQQARRDVTPGSLTDLNG
jgi:hypothetical protein